MRRLVSILAVAAVVLGIAGNPLFSGESAKGNLRYSITVSKFDNKAGWHGQWDLGDAWGAVMTDALQASGKFIVLGEKDMREEAMAEQDLAEKGRTAKGKKTPKMGQMTPAQLLAKGDITHVQDSTTGGSGGISFKGISIGGSGDKAEVNATIYVVDSQTGQVKASTKVVGKAGRKGLKFGYSGSSLGGLTGDMAGFKKDNVGKAVEDAVSQSVEFLVKQLDSIPWEGSIATIKDSKIIINRGSREGVSSGQQFAVGSAEDVKDEDTGETLDRDFTKVAVIKTTEVKEKVSYCEAVENGKKIEKGMTIRPL